MIVIVHSKRSIQLIVIDCVWSLNFKNQIEIIVTLRSHNYFNPILRSLIFVEKLVLCWRFSPFLIEKTTHQQINVYDTIIVDQVVSSTIDRFISFVWSPIIQSLGHIIAIWSRSFMIGDLMIVISMIARSLDRFSALI